jgi:hypothetical protein
VIKKSASWKQIIKIIFVTALVLTALQPVILSFAVLFLAWWNRDHVCEGLGGFAVCGFYLPIASIIVTLTIIFAVRLVLRRMRERRNPHR